MEQPGVWGVGITAPSGYLASPAGADAIVSWWVVDEHHGGELERALDGFIPTWLADVWGFRAVHYFPAR